MTSVGGWRCARCGLFVPQGCTHQCPTNTIRVESVPLSERGVKVIPPLEPELERIASALERIAAAMEGEAA